MVFDAICMFQTLLIVSALTDAAGVDGLAGFAAFGAYKAIAVLGMRRAASAARSRPPARLLLLRVFGHRKRSERFCAQRTVTVNTTAATGNAALLAG